MSIRVAAYVDGFNLYHGVHSTSGRRHVWLDIEGLVRSASSSTRTVTSVRSRSTTTPRRSRAPVVPARTSTCGHWPRRHVYYHPPGPLPAQTGDLSLLRRVVELLGGEGVRCKPVGGLGHRRRPRPVRPGAVDQCRQRHVSGGAQRAGDRPRQADRGGLPPTRRSDQLRQDCHGVVQLTTARIARNQLPQSVTTPTGGRPTRPAYWR